MAIKKTAAVIALLCTTTLVSAASAANIVKHKIFKSNINKSLDSNDLFSWSGAYDGVGVGLTRMYARAPYEVLPDEFKNLYEVNKAAYASVYGGYNFLVAKRLVLGIDLNVEKARIDKKNIDRGNIDNIPYVFDSRIDEDLAVDANLRVGYTFGRFLPYVTGVYSFDLAKYIEGDNISHLNGKLKSSWNHGWNIGAGVEYAVKNNLVLRAEYTHRIIVDPFVSSYDEKKHIYSGSKYTGLKLHSDYVTVGVAYKF